MYKRQLTGTPEVKVKVTYKGEVTLDNWIAKQDKDAAESYYCPLKVKVGNDTLYGLNFASEDAFKAAIVGKIDAVSKEYSAGTDLSTVGGGDSLAISWEWEFEGANGTSVNRTDYADTCLGNKVADADTTNDAKITIKVITTVTQID